MYPSIYQMFVLVLTLISAIHLCKGMDSELTSRLKRQSPSDCGPLKRLISEKGYYYVNGTFTTQSPTSAKSGTLVESLCRNSYMLNDLYDLLRNSYRCENGEWISIMQDCQPICGVHPQEGESLWIVRICDSTNKHICTGTIISPYYVLTDAQSFTNDDGQLKNKTYYITTGDKDECYSHAAKNVKMVIIHEDYTGKGGNYDNDIALLEVDGIFNFDRYLMPVCVDWESRYESSDLVDGNDGKVVAWEYANINYSQINSVRLHTVTYSERKICLNNLPQESHKYFSNNKFCAKHIDKRVNKCYEGNGGGLFFQSDTLNYFISGVSTMLRSEDSCNSNRYKLYTRVSSYLTWLRNKMVKNMDYYVMYQTPIPPRGTCVLPEHVQYGNFATISRKAYLVNKGVSEGTIISLHCNEANKREDFFVCDNQKWKPSIEGVKCKVPGSCPPLRDSISEEVLCNLNGSSISCETPIHNVIAIVSCRPFYTSKESRSVYKCENGIWNQTFTHCIPECGLHEMGDKSLPWIVSIYNSFNNRSIFGTLISPYHVLTVMKSDSKSELINLSRYTVIANIGFRHAVINGSSQTKKVKSINYKDAIDHYRYYVALIELEEQFNLSAKVRPVCVDWSSLYEESDFKDGNGGLALGLNFGIGANMLSATYRPKVNCITVFSYDFWRYLAKGICIRLTEEAYGVHGGGLFFKSDGTKYFIRGINSLFREAWHYVLYNKVSNYLTWLMFQMKANENLHMKFTTKNEDDLASGCILPE